MKYVRQFTRRNERRHTKPLEQQKHDLDLAKKILSAVTAFSFIGNPFAAMASEIVRVDGGLTEHNGSNVHNIYAGQIVGNNTAVNRFDKFNVTAGDIANMYFQQKDGAWKDNLVNFVNSRIDVHGTLNAIKENKIGGNLFFLSPEGMAVGKSGVINVGSLYVMTPANVSLDEATYTYHGLSDLIETDTEDALNRMMTLSIPVNSSGTISVLGKINSVGDVKMAAAKIAVGKNVSGEDWIDGTKNGEIVKDAAIRTGNTAEFNFSDLVNIKDENGKVLVDAGLGNDLTAIENGNGDIVLSAKAEDKNTDYSDFKELGQKLLDITVDFDLPKTIEASVENYGTIKAKGDAVLKAEATNGNKDWAEETLDQNTPNGVNNPDYVPVPAADADNYVQVIANVNVQGDITAGGDVELIADADNTYVDNGTALTNNVGKILGTAVTPMAANVMILSNNAQITVGKAADVTAGGTIDVHANAVLDGTAGAAANGRKLIKLIPDAIPSAAVGYANAENSASVQIDGTLTANGKNVQDESGKTTKPAVSVSAYAEENLSNTATMNLKSGSLGAGSSALAASVVVSDSKNTAEVAINGVIQADKGDARITSDTNTLLVANAATKAPDDTTGATAVNVMTHNGQANIVINGDITAQNVDIDATNYIDENTITANNSLGMGKFMADAMNAANVGGITNALKQNPLVQSITNKDGTAAAEQPGLFKQLSEKLAVGAAIVVADETNSAKVTFGKTADVAAMAGNVRADADVNIYDSHIYASGTANSYKKSESGSTDTVTVGTGVVYAGMDNTASVVFEDGFAGDENHTSVTATKDINITSGTTIEYNRPERIKREIDRSIENLNYAVEAIKNLPEYEKEQYKEVIDGLKNLQEKLMGYAKAYSSDFMDAVNNPDAITAEGTANRIFDAAAGAVGIYNDVMDLQQNVNDMVDVTSPFGAVVSNALGVVTNAVAFTDPNNYANVAASSSAKGGQESTKLSVAGSVTVTDFNNTTSVDVGKFTELKAGQNLDLKSVNAVEDVTITGKTMFWKNDADAKGGVGIGASVNYQNFDTYSKVTVDEGASLIAGDISIGSDSNIFHVGAMLGAGKSDGSAISGMVTITDSDSYNEVVVDSDAVLEALKSSDAQTSGTIDIRANNNTSVNNAILSISASGANVGAGIGVALNNIDVQNTAQIIDNDGADDEDDELKGKLSASALSINAETTGLINAISIAGGVTSSGKDESKDGEEGFFDKIKAPFNKINETKDNALTGISNISNKLQGVLQTMDLNASAGSATVGDEEAGVPGFSFAGAGSVSLNLVNDTTKAVVDGANIQLENEGQLQVGARDSAFTGSWSGGAALSFRKGTTQEGQSGNTSVAISGAVGVNDIDNEITALVKNSTITGAKDVGVAAVSGGTTIAAGLGATLTSDATGGKNYSGGASVSVNLIDKDVNANMDGVTLTGVVEGEGADQKNVTDIDVTAYESDVQVTGGVRADIATGGGSLVGGGVTVADIHNNINAGITGGSYTDVNDVNVKGMLATTQVTAAVSAGVATGGSGTNNAFSGAAVYNGLSNSIESAMDGAMITAGGTVSATAKDTEANSDEAKPYQELLGDYTEHNQFAADRGIDTAGTSFYEGLDTAGETIDYDGNAGSTIVGAAVVAAGSNGNAGGAAINIADIDNDFSAAVKNAGITANTVLAKADADTLLVGTSGGVAVGTKTFGGMGSVTWQDIDNDVTAQFVNSQITTNAVAAKADNNTQAINVAGSVSVGKSAAVGATLAYNALDNTIGSYMKGNAIKALHNDVDVIVDADNTGKVYGIGAGVAASTKAAINGSVAVNRGGSNTEAVIDKSDEKKSYIEDAGMVQVTADDDTYRLAVVGSVSASGKAAIGGGVAYNDIGGSSAGSESNSQNTSATIKNTDITTADNGEYDITVKANDKSQLMTIAAGVAAAANAGVQGSAATSLVNKNVSALVENTDIDERGGSLAEMTVDAQNNSQITSSADTGSFAAQGAGVGAGVAVNRIVQQTNAAVNGGVMNVNNLTVLADGKPQIENVGVGIAVAGQGAGVAGSVSVNMIDNDVTAHIGGDANIVADGSVGVVATSDEQISNYTGQVAVGAVGAGVGLSVSVNQITGTTAASVGDEGEAQTKVSAAGNGSGLTTDTMIDDTEINDEVISKDSVNIDAKIDRDQETRNGLIVDASSARDLKSFLVTAGVAGEGAGVSGTVNVNQIDGATNARIVNAAVNGDAADGSAGNVYVNAGDYSNSSGFVGSAAVGGIGAGVGLGSDTNTISRDVTATVQNSDIKAGLFELEADAKQGISSLTIGVAAAGIGAGVSNATSVALLEGKTTASVNNANITASKADVLATHTSKLNTMGAVLGAAGMGAGVGVSVSVLNENSETTADVTGTTISLADDVASDVNVKAENSTKVDYELYSIGGGLAGAAGAIGVSNVNSKVNASVIDSQIGSDARRAHDIHISGVNTIDFINNSGSGAGGAAGVGVGVAVNTIDSQVNTSVSNSTLYAANDINATAQETRKIEQMAVNAQAGGAAVGANVMITNVGSAVAGSYGSGLKTDEDGNVVEGDSSVNIDKIYEQANNAVAGNKLQSSYTNNQVSADNIKSAETGRGGAQESIVKVTIDNNASLNAGNTVTANAAADTSVSMDAIQASGGAVASANGTVGILNVHRNSAVEIHNTTIDAKALDISTTQMGMSGLNIYQGTLGGGGAIGAAYGSATSTGVNAIDIAESNFDVDNDIAINAKDQSKTEVNAIGVALAGGGAASVIIAEGTNDSKTTVRVEHTTMKAGNDIDVHAERKADGDSLSVSAIAASGGLIFAGAGVSAIANELGTVGAEITDGSTFTAGNDIYVTALNSPSVKAVTGANSASMLASAALTVAEANIGGEDEEEHLKTIVAISDGNTFTADNLTAEANVNASQQVDMQGISISASPFGISGAAQVNTGGAVAYSDVEVTVGNNVFKGNETGIDLAIYGNNAVTQTANAQGIGVGTMFATGTNKAETKAQLSTQVTAKGTADGSDIHDVDIKASSYAKIDNDANGYGGAFIDISPYAAMVENNYTADTDVMLSGEWKTTGGFTAQALNGMDIDLKSDAVRAAVVGGSGTWLNNVINNMANVTLDGATITTDGVQSYVAQNQVDYVGEIDGSGYGGINVNATDYKDDLDFAAGIAIENSTLTGAGDEGSITAFASTEGTIHSKNSLKSAGVIPVALAFSDHGITYNNSVNVTNSTLTTDKKEQDITLAATDDTDVKLETIADTQGGAVGAASAEASNTLGRSNKITVGSGSTLHSTNDVNLYAGADTAGVNSSLILEVLADAYNKTAIPLATNPSVENKMTQANQVELDGTVESVRHINAKAEKGSTTVSRSAQEYKVWTGTGGNSTVASTASGETIKDETANNWVDISGEATAGIHNKLDITIKGHTTTTKPTYDDDNKPTEIVNKGSISYDGIQIDISEGGDWFSEDDIKPSDVTVVNGLYQRYQDIVALMQEYDSGSQAFKDCEAEKNLLLIEMEKAGLAERDSKGNLIPLQDMELPAIEIPDIVVSGGNINISADTLTGNGTMTAQGAPLLSIENQSDLYLQINDLTISDNGGLINVATEESNSFSGTQHADGVTGETSKISVKGTSGKSETFGGNKRVQADISILGNITNAAGDVEIQNENYNILMQGNVSGRNISVIAENGSVTQTSSQGIQNIGHDPVNLMQFSETVAKKIQDYLYKKGQDGDKSFSSYQEYLKWLIDEVRVTKAELGFAEDQSLEDIEAALTDESSPYLAGDNIYIDAVNINVGGLIQSGYGEYGVKLTEKDQSRIDRIKSDWASGTQGTLTDADVMKGDAYLVNTGGAVWNKETKVYDYQVKVYYNPSTDELVTESVAPKGGQIQLSGKISSTGDGRIIAADGTADISIDTSAVDKDVKVNSITGNDLSGLITITDKNQTNTDGDYLVTEYRNGQHRSYYTGDDTSSLGWTNGMPDYSPLKGSQFTWTGGVSGESTEDKSYTEKFVLWGLITYDKSKDLLDHIQQVGGTINTGAITSAEGDSMGDGTMITDGYTGNDFLTIHWDYSKDDSGRKTDPGAPDKKYDGTAGKIFGYGWYTYHWKEIKGDQMASSTGLKADYDIGIDFIGDGKGDISVTTGGDMTLAGNISNASVVDGNSQIVGKGSVSLTSQNGEITGSSYINSDNVTLSAAGDINVNHAAIGSSAVVNITSDNGDIHFTSSKGDLSIEQAVTGGTNPISAETGSVYLEAAGSILDDAHTPGGYAVKGQRIDLLSHNGSIGSLNEDSTVTNEFRILGGSELYSSDTMASSVNASAKGDVVLTQTAGNMRLGTITSTDGDAVLTVENGSFVDAHPSENSSSSSAQDKIDRWLESGLINSEDGADESTKATEVAKDERIGVLEERMESLAAEGMHSVDDYKNAAETLHNASDSLQEAKDAYIQGYQKAYAVHSAAIEQAGGDKDAIEAADAAYKQAVEELTSTYLEAQSTIYGDKFSIEEQQLINSYAETAYSENYGWSKNQLLYAIQDSILNSEPGMVDTVETPNVTANNITLNAKNGGIGIDSDAQYIKNEDLNNVENLQLLAAAKAGDLTWDKNGVTIRQQQAITVQVKQENGQVDVIGRDNVYLAGVSGTKLDINDIETSGDIRLQGDLGVDVDSLKGNNLTIAGGSGDLTSSHNEGGYIYTELRGSIDANAEGTISFESINSSDLKILTAATKKALNLKAAGDILMQDVAGSDAQGRINAAEVNFIAGGSIGGVGENQAIRILDNGAVVNAEATGGIWISGESGEGSTDNLVIGDIKGGSFDLTSVSDISLGRADDPETDEVEKLTGSITTTNGDASILAVNVDLADGIVNTGEHNFYVTANGGSITQSETSNGITANHVNLSSTGIQTLASENNQIQSVIVTGLGTGNSLTGGIELVSNVGEFNVDLNDITVNDGGINVSNVQEGGTLNVSKSATTSTSGEMANTDIILSSLGDLVNNGTLTSASAVTLNAVNGIEQIGNVIADSDVTAETTNGAITFGREGLSNSGNVTSTHGSVIAITGVRDIVGYGIADEEIKRDGSSIIAARNTIAGNDVMEESTNGTSISGQFGQDEAESKIAATTGGGDITIYGTSKAGKNIYLESIESGNILVHGTAEASGDTGFTAKTKSGNIALNSVKATTGDVTATSQNGSITTFSDVDASRDVAITAASGLIDLGGEVTAHTGAITAKTTGNAGGTTGSITISGNADAGTTITLTSDGGAISVTGNAQAAGNVTATTQNGAITFGRQEGSEDSGTVTSTNGSVTTTTGGGAIAFYGNVSANGGNIKADTVIGTILLNGLAKAEQDILLTSGTGAITVNGASTAGKNFTAQTANGDITLNGDVTAMAGAITAEMIGNAGEAAGTITVTGNALANGNIKAETTSGAIIFGQEESENGNITSTTGSVMATTDDGDITIYGTADASREILLNSRTRGNVHVYGLSTAGTNFTAATGAGNITLNGDITADTGKVIAQTSYGNIFVGGMINSALNTELMAKGIETDDTGNITVTGEIASGEEVHASATNGDIRFNGKTTASKGDVTANVIGNGNITFNGSVTAHEGGGVDGNIVASVAGIGNITTESDAAFNADKDVNFTTHDGNITTNSTVAAGQDFIAKTEVNGNMVFNDGVFADRNVQFTTQDGDITANSAIEAGQDVLIHAIKQGDVTIRDNITAANDITMNTRTGNILFEGTQAGVQEAIEITAAQGNVDISIGEHGDIKDTHRDETGDQAIIRAEAGDVTIANNGITVDGNSSDVDLYEVYAQNDAGISVADGDLHLVNASGKLVAILVKTPGKTMDVQNVEAATEIQVAGSNMDLDNITQREDGSGFLVISPNGTDESQPIDNLSIGNIKTNGGVRFDHLWLNTGDVHVSEGALHLDKVYVLDKASFSTDEMTTNVFGSAPVYDDSVSSSYWVNTSIHNPKDNLDAWLNDGVSSDWMYIRFSPQGTVQSSNGNLLHLADHSYVYNQRYSQVDWMNIFTDSDFHNFYDKYYMPELSYHSRYNLLDGEGYQAGNAQEEDIVVE